MNKGLKVLFLGCLLLNGLSSADLQAGTTRCGRIYIKGFEKEHEMGLKLLGKGAVHKADQMSVYITVQTDKDRKVLYIQSNYYYKKGKFPQKLCTDEEVDLLTLLAFIHDPDKGTPFKADNLTFFVDQSFLKDPIWGKFQDEMGGTIHVLGPDGSITKTYAQKKRFYQPAPLQFFIPAGWVDIKTGSPELPLSKIPQDLKDAANQPGTKLFAFDPKGLKDGPMASMTLEEEPIDKNRLYFIQDLQLASNNMAQKKEPDKQLYEHQPYTIHGKRVFRMLMDRKNPGGTTSRLLEYYFLDGLKAATLTFITDAQHFHEYSKLFQDSAMKTLAQESGKP